MVHGVHRGDDGEQHLRGADVARRLLATDVLLARLQRETERGAPRVVLRHSDEAAGERPREFRPRGDEPGMRSTEAEGNTEPLRRADDDVRPLFSGRDHEATGEEIGRDDHETARLLHRPTERMQVTDLTGRRRRLDQHREGCLASGHELLRIAHLDVDAERLRTRLDDRDRVRVAALVDDEAARRVLRRETARHRHRFRRGGGFVEQRRVRELHPREVADHRLEVQERLEAALRDLRLVRRVRRVPRRILEHVALDDRRGDGAVIPEADQRRHHAVAVGEGPQRGRRRRFAERGGQSEGRVGPNRRRHGSGGELVERRVPELRQHLRLISGGGTDVAIEKSIGRLEVCHRGLALGGLASG